MDLDIEKAALLDTGGESSTSRSLGGTSRRPAIRVPLHIKAANHAARLGPSRPMIRYLLTGAVFAVSYWVLSSFHGRRQTHVIPSYVWEARAADVRAAFQHAYRGYELLGFPHDEIKPISNDTSDQSVGSSPLILSSDLTSLQSRFNGWGVTTVDSLDTMAIMGLEEELRRGLKHVERLNFHRHVRYLVMTARLAAGC